jgi:hypothetical protein
LKIKRIKAQQYSASFFQEKKSEKLHVYELYTLNFSPNILKQSNDGQQESRNLCLAWDIREIQRKRRQESLKEGGYFEYLGIGERIILKWILMKWDCSVWIRFIRLRIGFSGGAL